MLLSGGGTLQVVLKRGALVVNGADRELDDYSGSSGRTYKVIAPAGVNAYRTSGVYVLHDREEDGEIDIEIGEGAWIGTAKKPAGQYGAFAHFKDGDGDISIMNRGEAHGHFNGIQALHEGSGDVVIKTAEGSLTSMGIWAKSRTPGESGSVMIENHGRVEFRQRIAYSSSASALVGIDNVNVDADTRLAEAGIQVNHVDSTPGTNETPSSSVTVVSSGDIDVDTMTKGRSYVSGNPWKANGIEIESKGGENSVVPVTVDVKGGTITANARTNSHGIRIHHEHRGGLVKVDFAGSITRTGLPMGTNHGGDGIHVYRTLHASGLDASIKESDIEVTLSRGARIGTDGEGDESTVGQHGLRLEQEAKGGSIKATVETGARIGTEGTPVGGDGIWNRVSSADHAADITVTSRGIIHAKGSGVYAWHQGRGDVVVRHEAGEIKAGDAVGELGGRVAEPSLPTTQTAGIFAFHGGSAVIRNADGTPKSAEIGKVEIASGADIKSEGDGILAYVKHVDATHLKKTAVPITVDVSGGTVAAKGYGVRAETATDYATSIHQTTDATQAGKIEVTVGAGATVMAEKDGVRVAGKRVFASDHARAGQRDQKVIIHGKVMGGGSGSAGAMADGSGASVRTSGAAEPEPAGVHMVGGGTLTIGPRAEVGAGSGVAVRSTDALTITMEKDDEGRIGDVMGKILNSGTTTFKGVAVGDTVTALGQVENRGVYDGGTLRRVALKAIEGGHEFAEESAGEYRKYHARARVYEALPSVLLDLSAPTSPHARRTAARDADGGWARVSFSDGEREAERSATEGGEMGRALVWDMERWSAEMGFDVPTSTEGLLLGVSAHYRDGRADVEHGGRIDVSGFGVGASATYEGEDGWYWDGQVSYTRLDDIDLSSRERGKLVSGLEGDGYAVGVEVGKRVELEGRELVLTPRGGLVWSSVDFDNFNDVAAEGFDGDRRVGFGSEDSFKGRIGVLAESADGHLHASLDVEREFSEERSIMASGTRLESEGESTWARLGAGFRAELDEAGEAILSGEGFYALADGDNHDYGASVALRARF